MHEQACSHLHILQNAHSTESLSSATLLTTKSSQQNKNSAPKQEHDRLAANTVTCTFEVSIDPYEKERIKNERRRIRERILNERKQLSEQHIHNLSLATFAKLIGHQALQGHTLTIASYVSTGGELNTSLINEKIIELGHTLALPVMDLQSKGKMDFYTCANLQSLVPNRFNIYEPNLHLAETVYIHPSNIDIILMPLVGFNSKGERLGMGGGYYDRMLKLISDHCLTIGLAYDFQYCEEIISQEWDMPLHEIITPKQHLIFRKISTKPN